MLFEWDDGKDEDVRAARGFGFADAVGIFFGRTVEWEDDRHAYGETRMVAVGAFEGDVYTVVDTGRGEIRRIITAWHSERWERLLWQGSA